MNGPGVSLFQGADSIQLNNTHQREEEEEELLAEEKNRQAELDCIFEKAFDDLIDDDDDSSLSSSRDDSHPSRLIDHSIEKHYPTGSEYSEEFPRPNRFRIKRKQRNFKENIMLQNRAHQKDDFYDPGGGGDTEISAHYEHCFRTSPAGQQLQVTDMEAYKRAEYNSIEQLKILHDCRLREIDRLNSELNAEREEKQLLVRKLTHYEEENKRLQDQHLQVQSLLSDSKNTIIDLEKEISRFKEKLKDVEKAREEAQSELEIAKVQILHQEEKYVALKRSDLGTKREKQMDSVVESLKAAHKKDLNFLQQHLDAAVDRLNKKEDDYNLLHEKLFEMERKHAETLLSKCDSTIRQEATVKSLLDESNKEKLELMKRVKSLESQCSMLRADLEQCESVSQLKFVNSSTEEFSDSFQFLRSTASGRKSDPKSVNMNQTDLISKYKDELQRALIGQRSKRKEIIQLQEMVQAKEIMINKMKEQERKYLAQTESLKADMHRIVEQVEESKCKNKDIQNDQFVTSLEANVVKLEREKKSNIEEIKILEREVQDLKNKIKILEDSQQRKKEEYILFHEKEIEKLQKQNELYLKDKELEWGREMEKLMTESDEIKQLYMELKDNKDKLTVELKEMNGKFEMAMKERNEFQESLIRKQNDIKELEDRLVKLMEEKENLQKGTQEELQQVIDNQLREIAVLRSQFEDITKTDAEELQRLRDEIALSKMRFVELEKTLRTEFESDIVKLKSENLKLKDYLKRKETEISLRKMCMPSKNDVSTETDEVFAIETINEHNLAEIHKLENEIDRLRTLEKEKSQEILKLQSSYHEKIDQERKELAVKLQAEHLKEVEMVEKRVKEVSLKYFSEEVEKMQVKHRKDIQTIKEDESKKFVEFKNLIHEKEKEVKDLKSSKERMDALLKKFEEERNKAAVIMSKWIKEIEEIKNEKEILLKELSEFKTKHEEFKISFENVKIKLKNTRKTALVYKRRFEEVRTSLTEKYNKLLGDIQKRVDEAIASREVEIENKFRDLEDDYKNKEKLLRLEIQRKQQQSR